MSGDQLTVFQAAIKNFLGPILPFMDDESITEILINGHSEIFIERGGKLERTEATFPDEDSLRAAVNNIAQSVGRRISEDEPRLDARLPDGSRIHVVLPPCARNGTTVSIRKFSRVSLTFKDYIRLGAITSEAAQFLDVCMFLGKNILVSGGTGSGKTTLLGVLCNRIPPGHRLILIEDSSELQIDYEHVVRFETKMADQMGQGAIDIKDLLKSSLRLRPDRIIVGEVRGSEALDLINAMNTGHNGSMGTVHANSPSDALVRLEALAAGGDTKISEKAIQYQIGSAVDLIVQIARFSDGSRKVSSITEVLGFDASNHSYQVSPLYEIKSLTRQADGRLKGEIEPTGNLPTFMNEIEDNQIPLPKSRFFKGKKGSISQI